MKYETRTRNNPVVAYHFVHKKLRDGRPVPKDGYVLIHNDELEMCASGLHASKEPCDALNYAPGGTLCLVECYGRIINGDDKLVCNRRLILKRLSPVKVREILLTVARYQANEVAGFWTDKAADTKVLDYLVSGKGRHASLLKHVNKLHDDMEKGPFVLANVEKMKALEAVINCLKVESNDYAKGSVWWISLLKQAIRDAAAAAAAHAKRVGADYATSEIRVKHDGTKSIGARILERIEEHIDEETRRYKNAFLPAAGKKFDTLVKAAFDKK